MSQQHGMGAVAAALSPMFATLLFLQVAHVASFNTKVYDFRMSTNEPDVGLLLSQGKLNFKILGKTLDLPYFKALAATSAVSIAAAVVRSLHLF